MYLLNGEHRHCIDVSDRGFQYGDGLFETIAIDNGNLQFFDLHLARLSMGCERLLIPMPDKSLLLREALKLCRQKKQAVLKLIITRGVGGRGYQQPETIQPTRVFSLHPFPDYPADFWQQGIVLRFCRQQLELNPALAGIKHLNRLNQVLARAEWQGSDIQEGVMLDSRGFVIEGTMSNVFLVKNQRLYTPGIDRSGVAGIIRSLIIKLASQSAIKVFEKNIYPEELLLADELFITNSIIGIWPVKKLDKHDFNVGPVTIDLQKAFFKLKQSRQGL